MAYAAMIAGDADAAHDDLRLARASNPNSPTLLASKGFVLLFSNHPAKARQALTESLRLDPRGPNTPGNMHLIAISHYY